MENTSPLTSRPREKQLSSRLGWAEKFSAKLVANGATIKKAKEKKTMKWIKVQEVQPNGCPCGYTEYISEDGTMGRQVWFDGYEEIYEIEK